MSAVLVLGIDAGNTKTVALLADQHGTVHGAGRAGPANIYVSESGAKQAIQNAVQAAWDDAGRSSQPVQAVCLSATGADWPEDFKLLEEALTAWNWSDHQQIVNDAVGALRAGSRQGRGVAVVCGTSAGIAARGPHDHVWHSSYWQEPEGAEHLGQLALRAVYRAELGIGPPTTLTERLLKHFGVSEVAGVLHRQTARHTQPLPPGPLARLLLDEAQAGDAVSLALVTQHGQALGDYALAAARQVGLSGDYLLVTSGGVMRHPSPILRNAMLERVQASHGSVTWQASAHEPVTGAVLLALEQSSVQVTSEVFRHLSDTCPPPSFFET